MRTISVASRKGGQGGSSLTQRHRGLSLNGKKRAFIIDTDPQADRGPLG